MRIESVGPSKQMLGAGLERKINFSIKYRGGVTVIVMASDEGWTLTRFKNDVKTSDVSFRTSKYVAGVSVASGDKIVETMVDGMKRYAGFGVDSRPHKVVEFIVSVLDVYGGPVKHINSVNTL